MGILPVFVCWTRKVSWKSKASVETLHREKSEILSAEEMLAKLIDRWETWHILQIERSPLRIKCREERGCRWAGQVRQCPHPPLWKPRGIYNCPPLLPQSWYSVSGVFSCFHGMKQFQMKFTIYERCVQGIDQKVFICCTGDFKRIFLYFEPSQCS